jgi:CRISPR/Cas system-associated endoribonuclease Cas2
MKDFFGGTPIISVKISVFECLVDLVQFAQLKKTLEKIVDIELDSLR